MWVEIEVEGWFEFVVDVKYIGVFEGIWIMVGRYYYVLYEGVFGNFYVMEFDVFGCFVYFEGGYWFVVGGFVYQFGNQ